MNLGFVPRFLKYDQKDDDNNTMKTLKGLFSLPTILLLSLILAGCMPDSLTKFKEDPPVKAVDQGGSGNIPDADENCVVGNNNGGSCTPISSLEYTGTGLTSASGPVGSCSYVYTFVGETTTTTLGSKVVFDANLGPSNVSNLDNFVVYSMAKLSGSDVPVSLNATSGQLSFTLNGFTKAGTYQITSTHAYTGNSQCAVITFSAVNTISKVNPVLLANEYVVLGAGPEIIDDDGVSVFNVGAGNSPNISSSNGANGVVEYIDRVNYRISVRTPVEQAINIFERNAPIDSSGTFVTSKSTIDRLIYSFDSTDFPASWPLKLYNDRNEVLQPDEIKMQNIVISPEVEKIRSGISTNGNYCVNSGSVDRRVIYKQSAANYIYLNACDLTVRMQGTVTDEVQPFNIYTVTVTNPKGTTVSTSFRFSSLSERPIKAVEDIYYPQNWKGGNERFVMEVSSAAAFVKPAKLTGKLNLVSGSTTITGTGTNFLTQLITGSLFVVRGKVYEVQTVSSNTSIVVTTAPAETVSNVDAIPINWVLTGYSDNGTFDTTADDVYPRALIESVNVAENEVYITRKRGYFRPNMSLSSGAEYISNQATLERVTFVFSPEDELLAPGITPVVCGLPLVDNGTGTDLVCPASGDISGQTMSFTSSPILSSGTNLNLSATTGALSEIVSSDDLPVATSTQLLTLSATTLLNEVYSKEFSYRVLETPNHLSYGNFVLLQLTDISSWVQGSFISSPTQVPLNQSEETQGIVRKIIAPDRLLVEVIQGQFSEDSGVDNIRYYSAQRAEIVKSEVVTARLAMSQNNNANADAGDFFTSSSGAQGVIVHVEGLDLYARTSGGRIANTDTLTNISRTPVQTLGAVTLIESNQVRITTSAAPTNELQYVGAHLINDSQTTRGIINSKPSTPANTLDIQVISGFFSLGDDIDGNKYYSGADATISAISTDPRINLYRGKISSIEMAIDVDSSDIEYEIIPALPTGLQLNTETGVISGNPTDSMGEKSFVIIARNEAGSTYYETSLKVHNSFEVVDKSELPSYYLHQDGPADANHLCRVTEDNILAANNSGNDSFRDLTCRLEVAELDLYNSGFKIGLDISAGQCQHFGFTPYNLWQHQPGYSMKEMRAFTGDFDSSQCTVLRTALTGLPTVNPFPDGEPADQCAIYGAGTDDEKNCDGGSYEETTYDFENANPLCEMDPSITTEDACGTCANPAITSKTACQAAAQAWDSEWRTGYCIYITPAAQDAAGCSGMPNGSWDSARNICIHTTNNTLATEGACIAAASTAWTPCGYQVSQPVTRECDGNPYECREGAIRDVLDESSILKGITGLTGPTINGSSRDWEFKGLTGIYASNMRLANFTKQNSCMHRATTTTTAFVDNADKEDNFKYYSASWDAYKNTSDSVYDAADPFMSAQPFYTFECLDSASEIIGRVRLQVREWDKSFTPASNINYVDPGLHQNSQKEYNTLAGSSYNNRDDLDNENYARAAYNSCDATTTPLPPMTAAGSADLTSGSVFVVQTSHGFNEGDALFINGEVRRVAKVYDADLYRLFYPSDITAAAIPVFRINTSSGSTVSVTGTPTITKNQYNFSVVGTNLNTTHIGSYLIFEGEDGYEEAHIIKHLVPGGNAYLETAPTQNCSNCVDIAVRAPRTASFPGFGL